MNNGDPWDYKFELLIIGIDINLESPQASYCLLISRLMLCEIAKHAKDLCEHWSCEASCVEGEKRMALWEWKFTLNCEWKKEFSWYWNTVQKWSHWTPGYSSRHLVQVTSQSVLPWDLIQMLSLHCHDHLHLQLMYWTFSSLSNTGKHQDGGQPKFNNLGMRLSNPVYFSWMSTSPLKYLDVAIISG